MSTPGPSPSPAPYTPGFRRRLLMFVLCLIGLIIVWGYVWYLSKQPAQPPAKPGPVSLITGTLC